MKKFFTNLSSQGWFLSLFPLVAAATFSYLSFFISGYIVAWLPLAVLTIATFVINRRAFGTFESHIFVALWFIITAILYASNPRACVAFGGLLTGFLFAMALMDWMDEPNKEEMRMHQ